MVFERRDVIIVLHLLNGSMLQKHPAIVYRFYFRLHVIQIVRKVLKRRDIVVVHHLLSGGELQKHSVFVDFPDFRLQVLQILRLVV